MVAGDAAAQAQQALTNVQAILVAALTHIDEATICRVYLASIEDYASVNTVYESFFNGTAPPARAAFQVGALPAEALVEIQCTAVIDDSA